MLTNYPSVFEASEPLHGSDSVSDRCPRLELSRGGIGGREVAILHQPVLTRHIRNTQSKPSKQLQLLQLWLKKWFIYTVYHQLAALIFGGCHWWSWWCCGNSSSRRCVNPSFTYAQKNNPHLHLGCISLTVFNVESSVLPVGFCTWSVSVQAWVKSEQELDFQQQLKDESSLITAEKRSA